MYNVKSRYNLVSFIIKSVLIISILMLLFVIFIYGQIISNFIYYLFDELSSLITTYMAPKKTSSLRPNEVLINSFIIFAVFLLKASASKYCFYFNQNVKLKYFNKTEYKVNKYSKIVNYVPCYFNLRC
jgi:hypothetical protein